MSRILTALGGVLLVLSGLWRLSAYRAGTREHLETYHRAFAVLYLVGATALVVSGLLALGIAAVGIDLF